MEYSFKKPVRSSLWIKFLFWALPFGSLWLALWYLPWQTSLGPYIWLRLGIGLVLFIIPGICAYGLLVDRSTFTFSHITFGFVISHLIFALLGTMGRLFHFSFETIKLLMAVTGTVFLVLYLRPILWNGIRIQGKSIKADVFLSVSLMLLVSLAACLVVIQRVLTDDDLTYLAYVTNWQHSLHLDFNDVIFGALQLVHPRFWLMSIPFAQALLANISNVPGILLTSGYYEPFLVILSVICWYELARTVKFSPRAAGGSAILQLAFLLLLSDYLHAGAPFFRQLSADKATAAFIMAPVFFQSLVRSLEQPSRKNFIISLLAGLSLTFTHPVILAYSVFIGGMFVLFNMRGGNLSHKMVLLGMMLFILAPQVALRFTSAQGNIPYAGDDIFGQNSIENMIQRWNGTQFYGFNPSILDMNLPYQEKIPIPAFLMDRGWLLFPVLSAVFAISQVRRSIAARFILASFLLCLLAGIPFTGWIIGYFLSAWMLERALWLFPFGLSAVYALSGIRDIIKARLPGRKTTDASPSPSSRPLLTITLLTLGLFLLHMRENDLPNLERFAARSQRYQSLALAGRLLDAQITDSARVLGTGSFNDLIPGISWKSKLLTFRTSDPSNMPYFTPTERTERIADSGRIFSRSTSAADRLSVIRKYDIRYLLIHKDDLKLFDDLFTSHPGLFETYEIGVVVIIGIK